MPPSDLQSRFCEYYRCAPDQYVRRALSKCLYPHARLLLPVIGLIFPTHYARDESFIRGAGLAHTIEARLIG